MHAWIEQTSLYTDLSTRQIFFIDSLQQAMQSAALTILTAKI